MASNPNSSEISCEIDILKQKNVNKTSFDYHKMLLLLPQKMVIFDSFNMMQWLCYFIKPEDFDTFIVDLRRSVVNDEYCHNSYVESIMTIM